MKAIAAKCPCGRELPNLLTNCSVCQEATTIQGSFDGHLLGGSPRWGSRDGQSSAEPEFPELKATVARDAEIRTRRVPLTVRKPMRLLRHRLLAFSAALALAATALVGTASTASAYSIGNVWINFGSWNCPSGGSVTGIYWGRRHSVIRSGHRGLGG